MNFEISLHTVVARAIPAPVRQLCSAQLQTRRTCRLKRFHYPMEMMLASARWYAAYPLSFRHLEEMMPERGVFVDHSTVHRWALKILPVMALIVHHSPPQAPSQYQLENG